MLELWYVRWLLDTKEILVPAVSSPRFLMVSDVSVSVYPMMSSVTATGHCGGGQ